MVFKKSFLFASLVLSAIHIQPALAMDDVPSEKEGSTRNLLTTGYIALGKMADLIDKIHEGDTPIQPSIAPLFEKLSDEIALKVLSLFRKVKDLRAVALTCKGGDELTKDKSLWELLKKTYFGHLPEEYIEVLTKDKKEQGFHLARTLLQQLFSYQSEEMKRLKEILSGEVSEDCSPMKMLNNDFKKKLCGDLEPQKNLHLKQHPAEIYCYREELLNDINTCLIEAYLKRFNPPIGDRCIFPLSCSITRLPLEASNLLTQNSLLYRKLNIEIDLDNNQLRWIPSEFFSSTKINTLNLTDNLLCYLPHQMENVKDHLTSLKLGNYVRFENVYGLNPRAGRQTSGNIFNTVPPVVLKLRKLKHLDMGNVALEAFPADEIYTALPELSDVNVSYNNLQIIPQSTFKGRKIEVSSSDKPAYRLLTLTRETGAYRGGMYLVYVVARGIASPFVCLYRMHQYSVNMFRYLCYKMSQNDIND